MKAREPAERHLCPLFQREISWGGAGGCYEVQEVREDSMDAELLPEPIDIAKANTACGTCRWYCVSEVKFKVKRWLDED